MVASLHEAQGPWSGGRARWSRMRRLLSGRSQCDEGSAPRSSCVGPLVGNRTFSGRPSWLNI